MLVLIPFDMSRFDSGAKDEEGKTKKPVMERILDIIKEYLNASNRNQEVAAFLTSRYFRGNEKDMSKYFFVILFFIHRFLTRPDIMKKYLPEFLDWALEKICSKDSSDYIKMGALKAVAAIYKQGKRDDLLQYSSNLLERIIAQKFPDHPSMLVRKLTLKVIQRLGLVFLKSKVAAWRYQRGSRSLALNLVDDAGDGSKKDNLNVR